MTKVEPTITVTYDIMERPANGDIVHGYVVGKDIRRGRSAVEFATKLFDRLTDKYRDEPYDLTCVGTRITITALRASGADG